MKNTEILSKAEYFNKTKGDLLGYECEICNNKGVVAIEADGELYYDNCKCMATRRSLRILEKSGLKNQIEKLRLDNYSTDEEWQKGIKDKASKFICDSGKWFFIGGQTGCGKTHICTAITGYLINQGKTARYFLWRDKIVFLKGHINDDEYDNLISQYKDVEVLYIDDFLKNDSGKSPTEADMNIAYELLNYRYNSPEKITIISSERTVPEILKLDEATGGRIIERAAEYNINIKKDQSKNIRLMPLKE